MTEKCKIKEPVVITTPNGISAWLFDHWLRADNNSSLLFINVSKEDDRRVEAGREEAQTEELARITKGKHMIHLDEQSRCREVSHRIDKAEYGNARRMCPSLDALDLTLKLQEVRQPDILQMAVMECLRDANFDLN